MDSAGTKVRHLLVHIEGGTMSVGRPAICNSLI
jgi:hypothetical protein